MIAIVATCWGFDECALAHEEKLKHSLLAVPGVTGGEDDVSKGRELWKRSEFEVGSPPAV